MFGCAGMPGPATPIVKVDGNYGSVPTETASHLLYEWSTNYQEGTDDAGIAIPKHGDGWEYCEGLERSARKRSQYMNTSGWMSSIAAASATGTLSALTASMPDKQDSGRKAAVAAMAPLAALFSGMAVAFFSRSREFAAVAQGATEGSLVATTSKQARDNCQAYLTTWHQTRSDTIPAWINRKPTAEESTSDAGPAIDASVDLPAPSSVDAAVPASSTGP